MVHGFKLWRRLAFLVGALAVLCALWAVAAAEGTGDLSIDFTVEPSLMVAPGDVTMTFVIRNLSNRSVQNIYLSSADGLLSEPIGQIGAGESQTLVRPHTVTQEELDDGVIAYTISHDPELPGGEKISYSLRAAIVKGEPKPSVSFTRQFSSQFVPRGGQVTVTYKIANTGNVALDALRIRDSLGDFTGRQEQLDVGETKTFISRVTLNGPAQSVPVLEYEVPGSGDFSLGLDPAIINLANSDLGVSFSVGELAFEKEAANAILILTNNGNVDYTNITVLDDVYGGVIADAVNLPSGAKPMEIAYTYPLRGEGEYRWRITGMSSAGETLDLRTNTLTLEKEATEATVNIELNAEARTPRINRPGRVTFDFTIANTGNAMGRDALLYEASRGEIRRLAVLPIGEPTRCSATYDVTGNSQFIFCLTYADAQGRLRTVSNSPIDISIAPDGVNPERTRGPSGRLQGESVKLGSNSSMFIVLLIIAGAALTVMITILAVTSVRTRRERLRRVAAEKQRVKAELSKTGTFPVVKLPPQKKKKK